MSRNLLVLQKKLDELDAEVTDAFRHPPPDPETSATRHQIPFQDTEQRFIFLEKLLSAELASQPQASDQLYETGQRLTALKAAFRHWTKSRNNGSSDQDDTPSVCSDCTQALLCDDVPESGSPMADTDSVSCEKSPEKSSDGTEESENAKKVEAVATATKGRKWGGTLKYCGAFGCGIFVGAICMVGWLSSSHHFVQYEASLVPPT